LDIEDDEDRNEEGVKKLGQFVLDGEDDEGSKEEGVSGVSDSEVVGDSEF